MRIPYTNIHTFAEAVLHTRQNSFYREDEFEQGYKKALEDIISHAPDDLDHERQTLDWMNDLAYQKRKDDQTPYHQGYFTAWATVYAEGWHLYGLRESERWFQH